MRLKWRNGEFNVDEQVEVKGMEISQYVAI